MRNPVRAHKLKSVLLSLFAALGGSVVKAELLKLPPLDVPKLAAEDRLVAGKRGMPLRYGKVFEFGDKSVGLPDRGLARGGTWLAGAGGVERWTLQLEAAHASNLALHFSEFRLPSGAELRIYAGTDKQPALRYSDRDNPAGGELRTPMVESSSLRLELQLPAGSRPLTLLRLGSVVQGYRDPFAAIAQLKSGSCNIDVACPEGDAWQAQSRSVAHYTFNSLGGSFVCTGQLLATGDPGADASGPRMLTAHHCIGNPQAARSMTFYWRYESPSCRPPGSASSGQPLPKIENSLATQSGATLLATDAATDFTVVQLDASVPSVASAWFSGWDRNPESPPGAVSIHHPGGHEKRISVDSDGLVKGPNCILSGASLDTHWYVQAWNAGTTEGGSSGSGLWRRDNGRLIGVLSGGLASCAAPNQFDCFGAIDQGWSGGGTPSTRLKDWLSRGDMESLAQDGYGACSAPTVSLESNVFRNLGRVGDEITFTVLATGGSSEGYSFEWDLDGDGVFERSTASPSVHVKYATALSTQVRVRVTDSAGCAGVDGRALDVLAAKLEWRVGTPELQCGNRNTHLEPGERWSLPITVTNTGAAVSAQDTQALIVNGPDVIGLPGGVSENQFGYQATTSLAAPALCPFGFIDVQDSPALSLTDEDDGRALIDLGGTGISLFGALYTQASMSTNGYVSFSIDDVGVDYDNNCEGELDQGGVGPRLHVLHDDLVLLTSGALRYRFFPACPSAGLGEPQGPCHVFQWDGLANFGGEGSASFQAVVYPDTGEIRYHYRALDGDSGQSATVGLIDTDGSDPLNVFCNPMQPMQAGSTVCLYSPGNAPATGRAYLELERPTLALPEIPPGQTRHLNLPFRVSENAACGANLSLDVLATVAEGQFDATSVELVRAAIPRECHRSTQCPAAASNPSLTEGFYADRLRGGNGLAVFRFGTEQSPVLGGIWYTGTPEYLSDWYTFTGAARDATFEADLFRTTNASRNGFGPRTVKTGRAWWASVDARRAVFAWHFENGERGAELVTRTGITALGDLPHASTSWVEVGTSGWGLANEVLQRPEGALEFWGAYLFDAQGEPRWVTGLGNGNSVETLRLFSYRAHCPGCPFFPDYADLSTQAGSLTRTLIRPDRATLSTSITLPAPLSGMWNRSSVEIQAFGDNNP